MSAGREEGLAGLVAAEGRVALAESVMKLPYIKATRNAELGQERFVARDDVITAIHEYAKKARIALEAAAPAGTAAILTCICGVSFGVGNNEMLQFHDGCPKARFIHDRCPFCHATAHYHVCSRAALATPSPQAPASKCSCDPETGRRDPDCKVCAAATQEQPAGSRATHREWIDVAKEQGCECGFSDAWRCARKKGITTSLTCYCPCHKYISAPAATQEPAGSALDRERCEGLYLKFSEPLMEPHTPVIIERVNGDCTVSKFLIARDEAHELINQLCEFLRVGSPRKVGEDARLKALEEARQICIAEKNAWRKLERWLPADAADNCEISIRALIKETEAARPSSVPVGEQKQEEGV